MAKIKKKRKSNAEKRGDWTPAHLTISDCTLIVALITVLGLFRALDYTFGLDELPLRPVQGQPPAVSLLNAAFPLHWYGYALAFTNLLLIVAARVFRKHFYVWLGHGLCAVMYLILFVGTIIPVMATPYLDGLRGATALLGPLVLHVLFWLRTGPKPLTMMEPMEPSEVTRRPL